MKKDRRQIKKNLPSHVHLPNKNEAKLLRQLRAKLKLSTEQVRSDKRNRKLLSEAQDIGEKKIKNMIQATKQNENVEEKILYYPLIITLYEITTDEIQNQLNSDEFNWQNFEQFLPQYVVDGEKVVQSDNFEFVTDKQKLFVMFDIEYTHPLLEYELNEMGVDYFFEYCKNSFCKLLNFLPKHSFEIFKNRGWTSFPNPTIIMIYLNHYVSYDYYSGGYEGDLDCWVEGFINSENVLVKYDNVVSK